MFLSNGGRLLSKVRTQRGEFQLFTNQTKAETTGRLLGGRESVLALLKLNSPISTCAYMVS